ncbi:hypothetical protein GIB67_042139 [Kingdonia uniflora]|uniref:Protein ECERIFERUM 1-like n=1 Tax=Kingdonia uniflora TaxID=39325 RepID=A0A7J7NPF3_9MAGN|nr:hypothetical protein GIB67_042139 [Kingdonia uniflora]
MASKPGPLTDWPWKKLGNFKYAVLAPGIAYSLYSYFSKEEGQRDTTGLLILPYLLWRVIHHQAWISLARLKTVQSKHRILDKSIEFEQIDRERNCRTFSGLVTVWEENVSLNHLAAVYALRAMLMVTLVYMMIFIILRVNEVTLRNGIDRDDLILLNGVLFYGAIFLFPRATKLPLWRTDGIIFTTLLHVGPTEFLYYWLHRALHHHFLYSRYHSHHHSSIVTEPVTAVVHPFAEHIMYFVLFGIPMVIPVFTGTASIASELGYITFVDFMNSMGHCNFELIPKWLFDVFPSLKYIMYTPSFHSLHHTQFRTNLSLFMPFYDYLYGTMDVSTDKVYETSLKGKTETPDAVYLMHPTTLESIYHLRPGFPSLASGPYASKWFMWMLWPVTYGCMLLSWVYDSVFTVERHVFNDLKMQTWAIPRYSFQFFLPWQREKINGMIEKAILKAEEAGVKVFSLGLLNQASSYYLNGNGELYIQKHPNLKIRIVDGSTLAVAVVLNSIPQGTQEVLLRGKPSKVVCAIIEALCHKGIQVAVAHKDDYEKLKLRLPKDLSSKLVFSTSPRQKVWLVEGGVLTDEEQKQAPDAKFVSVESESLVSSPSMRNDEIEE